QFRSVLEGPPGPASGPEGSRARPAAVVSGPVPAPSLAVRPVRSLEIPSILIWVARVAQFLAAAPRPEDRSEAAGEERAMDDHDQRFKSLLKEFFAEFFQVFFPAWADRFDFPHVDWLEQQVFTDPPRGERRSLDLVARLPLRPGVPPPEPAPGEPA